NPCVLPGKLASEYWQTGGQGSAGGSRVGHEDCDGFAHAVAIPEPQHRPAAECRETIRDAVGADPVDGDEGRSARRCCAASRMIHPATASTSGRTAPAARISQ